MLPPSHIQTESLKNLYQPFGLQVSVLRLDELDPVISGNKWFKLAPYLQAAKAESCRGIMTWGGPWSNHILATAAACREAGLAARGIIRGELPALLSPMLRDADALGMELLFISRSEYREKRLPPGTDTAGWLEVPEGGYGPGGRDGAAGIAATTSWNAFSHVLVAVGTGTTLAGLIQASEGSAVRCTGINVLKNAGAADAVRALLPERLHAAVDIRAGFEKGGYARHSPALIGFMNQWYRDTGIPSDFVYTGKLFRAADALVRQGAFPAGSRLLLVHSGGLQGNRSLPAGTLIF
ncbi:pyridoxal-phosphate dependent enzyme [Flaviaesturariibacter flavus]|uniref:Pyridoxal-phosphate dependent enzyme n=1 Tax=Flaviaesturariibacter flavus TaxID=2502780 RepID=A0A4R1BJG7_9BACT|nr:pyridoxal-phosphate dependent enzyme [Flaviaesturariibacter flavus]TCJ17429.1 pyridoxal-phosphate dependent enzyme [Flaviaesturariibacter flavus]